jgi:hypothetical protein
VGAEELAAARAQGFVEGRRLALRTYRREPVIASVMDVATSARRAEQRMKDAIESRASTGDADEADFDMWAVEGERYAGQAAGADEELLVLIAAGAPFLPFVPSQSGGGTP